MSFHLSRLVFALRGAAVGTALLAGGCAASQTPPVAENVVPPPPVIVQAPQPAAPPPAAPMPVKPPAIQKPIAPSPAPQDHAAPPAAAPVPDTPPATQSMPTPTKTPNIAQRQAATPAAPIPVKDACKGQLMRTCAGLCKWTKGYTVAGKRVRGFCSNILR